uniref:Alpha-2-macroglobulin bait region domain-containing protein n=1 Tax=Cyprinodon variegatus TaxID=28743 RepID=A0A3Q2CHU6_CYPVA
VSRSNGFLFIQTDKPLYTPLQKVKVRAFSMNQELRPANRSIYLTFKDPDQITVDIVEIIDVNNGIPSMQNPFKIPVKPKLGIWTIDASYTDDFTTTAKTDFEVKEYVLPSFSIKMIPQTNFISYSQFNHFSFKILARYLHGAPVAEGELFLRYGFVRGKNAPVIIPTSITRDRVSRMRTQVRRPESISTALYLFPGFTGTLFPGGITQEAEFATVKFVKSPYRLSLISTPPFIKPGLPYNIQVLVKDHLDQPVSQVPVRLVENTQKQEIGSLLLHGSVCSALFSCGLIFSLLLTQFETADPNLPAQSQASLTLEAVAYHSPNQRYLYINTPMFGHSLKVGQYANIQVYAAAPSYLNIRTLSYLVLSKGKVVFFQSQDFVPSVDGKQNLNFLVTSSMVPSIRLLVFYILHGEGTGELVADSVWMDIKDKCVNSLQVLISFQQKPYKPNENIQLNVRTNQGSLVALSAVDSKQGVIHLLTRGTVAPQVLRHIEQSDLGCGGGGGKNNADIFRLAGLTFMTNANADPASSSRFIAHWIVSPELGADFDQAPLVRSYFPESWLWEVLPASLPLSVDVPLPYQVVRGEQLELEGSVYNQEYDEIMVSSAVYPIKVTDSSVRLPARGVAKVTFTLMGLEPGEHTLTFTLSTQSGLRDVVKKILRVVVCKQELHNQTSKMFPAEVSRTLRLIKHVWSYETGELPGEVVSVILDPDGLKQILNFPSGSAVAELERLLPLVQVYQYLETSGSWDMLGADIKKNAKELIHYANPILSWLTQDQNYGEGFHSSKDLVLTLEAVTEYSKVIPRAMLNQDISIRYSRKGQLHASYGVLDSFLLLFLMKITESDDIIVSTGYGRGVSSIKVCGHASSSPGRLLEVSNQSLHHFPQLQREPVGGYCDVCFRYRPPPNEVYTESTLTVVKIQLPTGVEPYLEDLRQVGWGRPAEQQAVPGDGIQWVGGHKWRQHQVSVPPPQPHLKLFLCLLRTHLFPCRYRLPLDSEALVELWPTSCTSAECQDYSSQLEGYALDLQLFGCP